MQEPSVAPALPKVLIIDDEEAIRCLCSDAIAPLGYDPHTAGTGALGMEMVRRIHPALVFLDINLPDADGMQLLGQIKAELPATLVVMITGRPTIEAAIRATKMGAENYVPKEGPGFVKCIRSVLAQVVRSEPADVTSFCQIIGISKTMHDVFHLIRKAAASDNTVLIEGESGTGKELVAKAIHMLSRPNEPFVPVDCGAIAPTLIESELFGHMAGAFTDARTANRGLLRTAENGTAFLDEIGELPSSVQVKLLRALQEMEVRPVGGTESEPLRARLIAATNRNLNQAVLSGEFRGDLFYRLHVIPIMLPPLRERREDIPLLVEHFMGRCGERTRRRLAITADALERLMRYDWPGNVRELENLVRRAYALLDGDTVTPADVDTLFIRKDAFAVVREPVGAALAVAPEGVPAVRGILHESTAETIRRAIQEARGNKRKAARELGIGIATLYRKIKKYGIVVEPYHPSN